MKIIFLGTPQFAVPTLQGLIDSNHEVVAVVTQPQKQSGRGRKISMSPVELLATNNNIPVYKFDKISKEGVEVLSNIEADILVTCAYGQILTQDILSLKKHGVINVHGSVLPKYRGASPIQWTVINGDKTAGITILKSEIGIDDGDVISILETDVLQDETSEELFDRLSILAPSVLVETVNSIENGTATYTKQNHEQATLCKKLRKSMSNITFDMDVNSLKNLINGINVWPVANIDTVNGVLKIYKSKLSDITRLNSFGIADLDDYRTGEVVVSSARHGLVVKAKNGFIELVEVQGENAKRMLAKNYLNGKKIEVGTVFNE